MSMWCKKNVPLYYIYPSILKKCPLLFWNFHKFFPILSDTATFLFLDIRKFQPYLGFSAFDLEFGK